MSVEDDHQHYSTDFEPDEDGWYTARCNCGWSQAPFPTAEDGCDALMDHAYKAGKREYEVQA